MIIDMIMRNKMSLNLSNKVTGVEGPRVSYIFFTNQSNDLWTMRVTSRNPYNMSL